jgi:iron complex outermembrane receptor protein
MSNTLRLRGLLVMGASAVALTAAGGARAADATAAAEASATGGGTTIGELVVTAEKREQALQDVPIAISAFTSQKRDLVGIQTIQDMTNFTPGLGYSTSTDRITLRGIGRTTNVLSADAPVANYDDGLYETFAVAAGRSSLDLARVEVLRGPQGTLAGRNALGGALNEITVRPSKEPYAELRVTYGNYNHITVEGAASGPLNDNWQWRSYLVWDKQTKGWKKNSITGSPDSGNIINEWYGDWQIQGKISDHLDMWTKVQAAQWWNGSGGPGADSAGWPNYGFPTGEFINANAFLYPNSAYACNFAAAGGTGPSGVQAPSNVVTPGGISQAAACANAAVDNPRAESSYITHRVYLPNYISLNSQWTWHADGFDIKYIGGGTYYHYVLTGELAVSPIISETLPLSTSFGPPLGLCGLGFLGPCTNFSFNGQYSFNYQERNGFISNEINFISTGEGPLQWVIGGYQFHQHYKQPVTAGNPNEPRFLTSTILGSVIPTSHTTNYFDNRPEVSDTSLAGFGQIDWQATETIKITAGLRYSHDRKYGTEAVRLLDIGNIVAPENFGTFGENNPGAGAGPSFDLTQLCSVVSCQPAKGVVSATTYDPVTGLASRRYDASWSGLSGTAGIQWQPNNDTNAYFKYGRGYKSGGFNIGIFTVLSFSPWTEKETVDSFEVGLKRQFGTWLTANVAAFYYSYKNLQIPIAVAQTSGGLAQSTTAFYNVPKAVSQGIELETTWTPVENLNIIFNYSYDDAHTTKGTGSDSSDPNAVAPGATPLYTAAQCQTSFIATAGGTTGVPNCLVDLYTETAAQAAALNLANPGVVPNFTGQSYSTWSPVIPGNIGQGWNIPQNLAGNRLPNAPKNKIAVNVLYTFKFDAGSLTPSVSYVWRDKVYGNLFTRKYTEAPHWDQWDARITWKGANGKYEILAFWKNIGNKIQYDQGSIPTRLSSVSNPFSSTGGAVTLNYVQGDNRPTGPVPVYSNGVQVATVNAPWLYTPVSNAINGVVRTFYPTPPETFGVEFRYKFF